MARRIIINFYYYLYSNYRQRTRASARDQADRLTSNDPLRPTRSLRVARRVTRVALSRPESLDRAAPNDQSRPKRAPETARDAIFDDFWSISGSIFEVFRGCIARATRLAARSAEPLFLLTGAALSRVGRLCRKNKIDNNRRKIVLTMLRERTERRKLDFSALGRDLVSILVSSACSQALPFWRPGAPLATLRKLPQRAGDAPGRSRDTPETHLGRSWTPRGVRRGSRERFSPDSGTPEVSPGINFRSIFV